MQLDTDAVSRPPGNGATATRPKAATRPLLDDATRVPTWVENVRRDPLYSVISVLLDACSAACAVVLAQWATPGAVEERHIAAYSWIFVPAIVSEQAGREGA